MNNENGLDLENTFQSIKNATQNIYDQKNPTIITFGNYSYKEIILNWVEGINRLGINNYIVIAMDDEIYNLLSEKSIKTVLLKINNNLEEIWLARIKLFQIIIEKGCNFIHSDADAVWLKNPIPKYFTSRNDLDLVISQGTIYPKNTFKKWGFVMCCGLFYVRGNLRTTQLFKEIEQHMKNTEYRKSDQKSLNKVIANKNINWDLGDWYAINMNKHKLQCSNTMMVGEGDDINVGVLPFKEFPRLEKYKDEPYVIHSLTPKDATKKQKQFKKKGLWLLE